MEPFLPYPPVAGVSVYRHRVTAALYAYGGPGRSVWLNLGLRAPVDPARLAAVVARVGALTPRAVRQWQAAHPAAVGVPPPP